MRDDLKSAIRSLRTSPTFTSVALIVLALGIGAATALFSVVDAVILRGLPFDEHDRLGVVLEYDTTRPATFGGGSTTPQMFLDWREKQQSFEALTAVGGGSFRLKTEGGEPADARALRVTHEFFPVFRVAPALGRALTAADEIEGQHRVAVLSYGFWQRRYGGMPDVVGRTIDLNEEAWHIVGVMPAGFAYPVSSERPTDVYVPAVFSKDDRVRGGSRNYNWTAIGRLQTGVSREQAQDDMHRLSEALDQQHPKWSPGRRARVLTLHDHLVGRARAWMLMLLAAVGLLLVIACANVANLMLARAAARSREVGIRAALGAGQWRLVRGLLVESLVLSCAGAFIGVLLAYAGVQLIRAWLPAGLPRVADIAIDLRVLGAAISAALTTGLLFGIAPAFHSTRADATTVLKEGGRSSTAGAAGHRLRNILVIAEVAIAVVLLVGAGLFLGSFLQLVRIEPGFDYRSLLTYNVGVRLPATTGSNFSSVFAEASKRGGVLLPQVFDAVKRIPGVVGVGAVQGGLPLTGSWSRNSLKLPDGREFDGDDSIDRRIVTPDYIGTLRIPLRRGRLFTDADTAASQPVAVINEAAARKYWNGQDALGQHLIVNSKERVVVGIIGDIRHLGPEQPPRQEVYIPFAQEPSSSMTLVVRSAGDPLDLVPGVKAAIWSVLPEQRLTQEIVTLEGYMDRLIAQRRFNMALLVLFGVLGLVITAAGIYGVMAYVVEQRTSEIGVRMALGATPGGVLAMVLRRAAVLMAIGVAVGGGAAWSLRATVTSFMFQIDAGDPRIYAAAIGVLASAGLIASAVPARRAASVDPLSALRAE